MSTKSFNQICWHLNLAKEFLDIQAKWYDTKIQFRVFSHLLFWNFCVATKSIKSSRTYQQCQLSLLHNKICQKKPNTRVLRKEIDFSPFYITGRNKLYRLCSCSLTILGHNGNVLKQKSTINKRNSITYWKVTNWSMILRKLFLIMLAIFYQKWNSLFF